MKKLFLTATLLFYVLIGIAQVDKVMLISFWGFREIEPGDFGGGITTMVSELAKDSSFMTQKYVDKLYENFNTEYVKSFPFTMMDENLILNAHGYDKITDGATFKVDQSTASVIKTFQPILYSAILKNKDAIDKAFTMVPEADLVMVVRLSFSLVKKSEVFGFGVGAVRANVDMDGIGKDNKVYFKVRESATSDKTFKFALGGSAFKASEIQPLCDQAVENIFVEMKEVLPKRIAKMEKALKKYKK